MVAPRRSGPPAPKPQSRHTQPGDASGTSCTPSHPPPRGPDELDHNSLAFWAAAQNCAGVGARYRIDTPDMLDRPAPAALFRVLQDPCKPPIQKTFQPLTSGGGFLDLPRPDQYVPRGLKDGGLPRSFR